MDNARLQRDEMRGAERFRLAVEIAGLGILGNRSDNRPNREYYGCPSNRTFWKRDWRERFTDFPEQGLDRMDTPDDRDRVTSEFDTALWSETREFQMEYRILSIRQKVLSGGCHR